MHATGPKDVPVTNGTEKSGPTWVAQQTALDRMIAPFCALVMDALAPRPGAHLVDVGCGCGGTSLELARRVGASVAVLGIDVSEPMLARARDRAAEHGF